MNWKKIKKKYPKAWSILISSRRKLDLPIQTYLYNRHVLRIEEDECYCDYDDRELYDFFDEQGINIQINVKCALNNSVWYLPYIWCDIDEDLINIDLPNENTRSKAEKAAFFKAFEILEKKLI